MFGDYQMYGDYDHEDADEPSPITGERYAPPVTLKTPQEGWHVARKGIFLTVVYAEAHDDYGAVIRPQDRSAMYAWPDHDLDDIYPIFLPEGFSEP